ncbi:AQP7 [Ramazzottius varieornatus]|uniref:AQP7 n=1 Tax=Ramazzottius varieornatus TaxID=947166 RepID=A0A1D1UG37_RAMVA|nr:AQP7 [Ramazzottius varieornatus]
MTSSWRQTLRNAIHQRNDYLRCFLSEFAGTFILVLLLDSMVASATFSQMMPNGDRKHGHDQVHVALGAALAVMMGVFAAAPSGANLNPAVSVAFMFLGELSPLKTMVYMLAQYLGAFVASATIFVVFRDTLDLYDGGNRTVTGASATAGIWATYPSGEHLSITTLFLDQILSTFILMFILLAIVDPKGWKVPKNQVPLYVGALIASIVFSLGYTTGAAMNPARDLMPRLFTLMAGWGTETFSIREYRWFFIPVIGSHLGAIFGAMFYQVFVGAHWEEDTALLVKHRNLEVDTTEFRTPVTTRVSERFGGGNSNEKVPLHSYERDGA